MIYSKKITNVAHERPPSFLPIAKKFHTIKDKRVEAKKAIPKVEMDARKRVDPRATMASSLMALSSGGGGGLSPTALEGPSRGGRVSVRGATAGPGFLWDSPYGPSIHHGYSTAAIDGYPPHYHSAPAHYGADWMMHGGGSQSGSSPYGIRSSHNSGAYGRSGYSGHAAAVAASAWQDYGGFVSTVGPQSGGPGPMRHLASYQHRSYRPYASGGGYGSPIPRGSRGYNP